MVYNHNVLEGDLGNVNMFKSAKKIHLLIRIRSKMLRGEEVES